MYEMLTGSVPFSGATAAMVVYECMEGRLVPPSSSRPEIPPSLESVILRAISREQGARYGAVGTMLNEIKQCDLGISPDRVAYDIGTAATMIDGNGEMPKRKPSSAKRTPGRITPISTTKRSNEISKPVGSAWTWPGILLFTIAGGLATYDLGFRDYSLLKDRINKAVGERVMNPVRDKSESDSETSQVVSLHKVSVSISPEDAQIFHIVDGKSERVDIVSGSILIPKKENIVVIRKEGYVEQKITLESDQKEIKIALTALEE